MKNAEILEAWPDIKLSVRKTYQLSEISYNTWLRDLTILKWEKNDLYVFVLGADPSELAYYDKKYKEPFETVIRKQYGNGATVIFCSKADDKSLIFKDENGDPDLYALPENVEKRRSEIIEKACAAMRNVIDGEIKAENNTPLLKIREDMVIEIAALFGKRTDSIQAEELIVEAGTFLASWFTGKDRTTIRRLTKIYIQSPFTCPVSMLADFTTRFGHLIAEELYAGSVRERRLNRNG